MFRILCDPSSGIVLDWNYS